MNHACLHDGLVPHRGDRVRQTLEAIAHHDAHVACATVLDLGEHRQPELRTLPAVAGPQPEDVALPAAGTPIAT